MRSASSATVGRAASRSAIRSRYSDNVRPWWAARALSRRCRSSGTFLIWIIFDMLLTLSHVQNMSLADKHRIAERVEAVALGDRGLIQAPRLLDAGECHHKCQERRARQVEVRQECIDAAEIEAGRDEELRAP